MNGIQDKYRIQAYWSTDELENHLSRTGDWAIAVNVWQRYKYSVKFANTLQCFLSCSTKFANSLQYLSPYPTKFAKSLQYPILSSRSPVPDPQYRDQQSSVTEFLIEDKSLPPPIKAVIASSGVAQLPKKCKFPKKKLGSR